MKTLLETQRLKNSWYTFLGKTGIGSMSTAKKSSMGCSWVIYGTSDSRSERKRTHMKFIKYLFIITFLFFLISNECKSQVKKDTLSILFIGNSYTAVSNMPHLVSLISDSTQVKLITSKSTAGGATLRDHWKGEKGLKTKEIIRKGMYDIVVLQEYSMGTIKNGSSLVMR